MNIYVGNLAAGVAEDQLREAFAAFGEVASAKIIRDGATGESRGFGFVTMPSAEQAKTAIQEMDGHELEGQALKVEPGRSRAVSAGVSEERPGGRRGHGPRRRLGGPGRGPSSKGRGHS